MPIETPHPLYTQNVTRWKRCRDAYEGEDAVKDAGTEYLPKIDPSQTGTEYEAYKTRALYYEAVGRTVDGFVGAISRKPHVVELPDAMNVIVKDATLDGTQLDDLIKKLASEVLVVGRCGLLVDYSDDNARAYLSYYPAESIISWGADSIVIMETVYEPDGKDTFKQETIKQIRQLHVVDGKYTVTLWREKYEVSIGGSWAVVSETVPSRRGMSIPSIPWFWLTANGQSEKIEKPTLLGLVNVSFSHYRSSADLEHGRHFTALPTLYITGVSGDEPIRVGAGAVIQLSDPSAKVGYAEFSGQGLQSLETALESKQQQMATLGAAVWGAKKGVEAAETARMRVAGENSLLMSIVGAIESGLQDALALAAEWMGVSGEIVLKINRDFIDQKIDAQTLVGMVQAYQAGAMSLDAFLYCLQQSEMLPPETEIDDEVAKLTATAASKAAASAKVALQISKNAPPVAAQHPGGDDK